MILSEHLTCSNKKTQSARRYILCNLLTTMTKMPLMLIFSSSSKQTHLQNPSETSQSHDIIIKAADLIWRFLSQKGKPPLFI